ncbi:MAG: pseudouridine-5'-phosphate glycosidase [Acidobacteriota bacterium]
MTEQVQAGNSDPADLSFSPAVARSLQTSRPIVALESTVIAHGLPAPHNLQTARACEDEIRSEGAEPATIGIVAGRPVIGLENEQLDAIASRTGVAKVSLANLGRVVASQSWGATTVAATLHLAHRAGIRVFATGGIGGVHRGAIVSFDISADLTALARYPLIVVCAGAKSILDLPKTLEALETLGVPVVGYRTDELPAFYSASSGLRLDLRADRPEEVVSVARAHWQLGCATAVLVVQPVPAEAELPRVEVEVAIEQALDAASLLGIKGKDVTPFLLSRVAELTGSRALSANIALLRQNARLAAKIAKSLAEVEAPGEHQRGAVSV